MTICLLRCIFSLCDSDARRWRLWCEISSKTFICVSFNVAVFDASVGISWTEFKWQTGDVQQLPSTSYCGTRTVYSGLGQYGERFLPRKCAAFCPTAGSFSIVVAQPTTRSPACPSDRWCRRPSMPIVRRRFAPVFFVF